jgi:diguanylate cyclase (GGDEF)-like protein
MLKPWSSSRRFGLAGLGLVAYSVVFAIFTLTGVGGASRALVLDLGQLVTPAAAMVLCYATSRRVTARRERLAWLLFALASLCLLVGFLGSMFREVIHNASNAPPTPVEMSAWMLCYPTAFVGLVLFLPRRRRGLRSATAAFDALIITGSALALSWQTILWPAFGSNQRGVGLGHLGWALGGLVLLFGLASHFLRWPATRVPIPLPLFTAAFALLIATDAVYAALMVQGTYAVGNIVDLFWPASGALLALAALYRLGPVRSARPAALSAATVNMGWIVPARTALPYVALPLAAFVIYRGHGNLTAGLPGTGAGTSVVLAAGLILLVILRQLVTLVENQRLTRSLGQLSEELEARVDARTRELSSRSAELFALNKAATRLAHCLTMDDVLVSGLRLACSAVNVRVGAIWLLEQGTETRLAARLGLPSEGDELMGKLPRRIPAAREALVTERPVEVDDYALLAYLPAGTAALLPRVHMLAVPLLSRDTVVGLMGLFGGEDLPEQTRALAESMGAQIGVAVDNARRYQDAVDLADRDALTGLLNHRAVHVRLGQELSRAARGGAECAILMMDLDAFKILNDTHGHQAGDAVLKGVAEVLRGVVRTSDVLGRYGGDEFMAILPDTNADNARVLAERIVRALSERSARAGDTKAFVGISIGVASSPTNGRTGTQLVAVADANMYASKQRGGNRVTATSSANGPSVRPAAVA